MDGLLLMVSSGGRNAFQSVFFFNDNPIRHKNSQAGREEIGGVAQKKIVPGDGQALDRNDLLLPRFRVRRSARNMPSSG